MAIVKPYSIQAAQALIKDSKIRAQKRHGVWRALEMLYRRGEVHETLETGDVPNVLWDEVPGITLEGINMVLPNTQILLNQSMAHDPQFLVEPYSGGDEAEQEAKVGEQLLRYFWKRANGTDVHRSMVQDMLVLGSGFCKVNWAFVEEAVERGDDELVDELLSLSEVEEREADLEERVARGPRELAESIDLEEPRIVMDEPFVEYVSPYDMLVPRHARRMDECRWLAQRVILPIDEIESNDNFDKKAIDELQWTIEREDRPGQRAAEEDSRGSGEGADFAPGEDPFREATIYEFYDMRSRRLMVLQEDAENALFDDELPYSHRHSPFVHMRNLEDGGRRFWCFGDVENVAAVQEEFNQYVFEQMSSARRSGNKYAVDAQVYTEDVKKLLESEQSEIVVPISLGQRNINDVIQVLERAQPPVELFQAKSDLLDAMHDVMGINDFQAGGVGSDRMAATTAAVVDGNATLRGSDKRWQVENSAAHTGLLMLLLCQEYLDEEFALRIVGPDGQVSWLDVSREDLEGEFGVSVSSGSTMAINPATRMARALDVMTQIIPSLSEDGYDTHPLWRQALRDYGMDPDRMLRRLTPEEMMERAGISPEMMEQPEGATVPQEEIGGPPVPAATEGDTAI